MEAVKRPNGWYWCVLIGSLDKKLHVFEWIDNYWQVYDMAYDDAQVMVIKGPLVPPSWKQ